MNEEDNTITTPSPGAPAEPQAALEPLCAATEKECTLGDMLAGMNLTQSVATAASAILEPLAAGNAPTKSLVELVVKALGHDQALKDADAAGYLRGRNEAIDLAKQSLTDSQQQREVTFPVYRKRSFWDQ